MTDIRNLLNQLAAQEAQLNNIQFLAPCVGGGRVKTRVAGIVYTFQTQPKKFEGWGIFQPINDKTAKFVEEPSLPQLEEYFQLLKPLRLFLAYQLKGQKWLAYPTNESDAKQRFGFAKPIAVHLVTEGVMFESIIARFDGSSWWFEDIDRRADPFVAEQLREAFKNITPPKEVRFKGITPEMKTVYDLVARQKEEFMKQMQQQRDEKQLREALEMGGGELQNFRDRSTYWQVEWVTRDGERHTSAIDKNDLTVVSAGICLSGGDRHFDLQSLVGVVEQRY
ncbi:hypothetical protein [Okeania sp. KiyG1]|uniref:hypothetical protein n=1 Tax=Okeania sp. KiyG1 TaxID=2720165 RepID=UPI0019208E66|nr:hypothetical protein [Okeania sp. KiyG1]GGA43139.1 hypothetical protein CYANOKiyG1_61730 [Okeania sp. KiyG1]